MPSGATNGEAPTTLLSPSRVLVAEDDDELRSLLAHALEADGYEVLQVEDGDQLAQLLSEPCSADVVISDVRMPRGGGLEALAQFRRRSRSTPFILITAFGSDALHEEAEALGATAIFDKPFDLDDLRAAVRRLLPVRHWRGDGISAPVVHEGVVGIPFLEGFEE